MVACGNWGRVDSALCWFDNVLPAKTKKITSRLWVRRTWCSLWFNLVSIGGGWCTTQLTHPILFRTFCGEQRFLHGLAHALASSTWYFAPRQLWSPASFPCIYLRRITCQWFFRHSHAHGSNIWIPQNNVQPHHGLSILSSIVLALINCTSVAFATTFCCWSHGEKWRKYSKETPNWREMIATPLRGSPHKNGQDVMYGKK